MIPHSRNLFKVIDNLNKTKNIRWSTRVNKTGKMLHEHFFSEIPLKKGIFDIKFT